MKVNPDTIVLAGSVWLAAAIPAWPARHPSVALVVLTVHAVLITVPVPRRRH